VLDDRGEEADHAEDDEAPAEDPGALDGIEALVQLCRLEVVVELPDAESEADQRQGRADPRQERAVGRLAAALAGELGIDLGRRRRVAHHQARPCRVAGFSAISIPHAASKGRLGGRGRLERVDG
jgi:hypothetical protein